MKVEIRIPKGWRRVRRGMSKEGDKFLYWPLQEPLPIWGDDIAGHGVNLRRMVIRREAAARRRRA